MSVAFRRVILAFACILGCTVFATADTITLAGSLFSVSLGPAAFNPSLNSAQSSDQFMLQFTLTPSLVGPGVYTTTSTSFTDVTAGVSETAIQAGSLTVSLSGSDFVFSGFACVQSGACNVGNELDLNFSIPQSLFDSASSTTSIAGLKDFELLEDDGATDLIGALTNYANASTQVPEPSSVFLLLSGITVLSTLLKHPWLGPR